LDRINLPKYFFMSMILEFNTKPRSLLPLSFLTHDSEREGGG